MSITIGVTPDSSATLRSLQAFIQQQEEIQGPLTGLGNDGEKTVIEIDNDSTPPAKLAILKLTIGDMTPSITGHDHICTGNCFINNQKLRISAYRPR